MTHVWMSLIAAAVYGAGLVISGWLASICIPSWRRSAKADKANRAAHNSSKKDPWYVFLLEKTVGIGFLLAVGWWLSSYGSWNETLFLVGIAIVVTDLAIAGGIGFLSTIFGG